MLTCQQEMRWVKSVSILRLNAIPVNVTTKPDNQLILHICKFPSLSESSIDECNRQKVFYDKI